MIYTFKNLFVCFTYFFEHFFLNASKPSCSWYWVAHLIERQPQTFPFSGFTHAKCALWQQYQSDQHQSSSPLNLLLTERRHQSLLHWSVKFSWDERWVHVRVKPSENTQKRRAWSWVNLTAAQHRSRSIQGTPVTSRAVPGNWKQGPHFPSTPDLQLLWFALSSV